jgi:hypothetical protein
VKQPPQPTTDETLVAIAERHEAGWRALMVRRGPTPAVTEARSFDGDAALASWLEASRCGDLCVVLPSTSTIIRTVNLPAAPAAQSMAAMRLQAEGMFLGALPACRIGMAVIDADGATEHQGAIMAWPESAPGVELSAPLEKMARFLPQPAAMLSLVQDGVPAVVTDRRDGAISIAIRTGGRFHLRATREAGGGESEAWLDGVRRAIAETALNAGATAAETTAIVDEAFARTQSDDGAAIMVAPDAMSRLAERIDLSALGSSESANDALRWASLVGAAIAATGPLADLSRLRRRETSEAPSRIERFVQTYSSPARALRVGVAAFAIVALAPIATAWLRGKILEWKMPESADKFQLAQRRIDHRMSLYRELSNRTVPVSKILGDLACCTPEGVEVETIQVSFSQGVTVRGKAKSQGDKPAAAILTQMVSQMDSSGVFEKTRCRWDAPDSLGFLKFDLEAPIVGSTRMPEFAEERDWAVKSLAQRKYGAQSDESASDAGTSAGPSAGSTTASSATPAAAQPGPTATASADEAEADPSRARPTPRTSAPTASGGSAEEAPQDAVASGGSTPNRGIGRRTPAATEEGGATPAATAGSGAGAGGGPAASAQANLAIPDPVSDDALKAMSREEAQDLLNKLSKAKKRADLDEATKKRVDADWRRVLDHLIAKARP